jgi:hypothetical protein
MFFPRGLDEANQLGIAGKFFFAVIPGHRKAMSPESVSQLAPSVQWIPGSRFRRAPE